MSFRRALILLLVAEATIIPLAIINYGQTIEALQAVARFSGRLSLLIFSVIFLFQKDERINVSQMLSEKYFLIFAIGHGIHLVELLSYIYFSGNSFNPVRAFGGAFAYAFIFLMPWLEDQWKDNKITLGTFGRIELFYLFYIWLIFFLTYLPRVQGKLPNAGGTYKEHVILLAWVCMLLGMKAQAMLFRRPFNKK
ncbi:MAG TPA: hypothetical protein VIT44_18355 [Cyclobacteriaceae bacterium]